MLGLKSTMSIIDNSGGLVAECIRVMRYKSSMGLGRVGDEIVVVVQKAKPLRIKCPARHRMLSKYAAAMCDTQSSCAQKRNHSGLMVVLSNSTTTHVSC